jgi:hypothetical protein
MKNFLSFQDFVNESLITEKTIKGSKAIKAATHMSANHPIGYVNAFSILGYGGFDFVDNEDDAKQLRDNRDEYAKKLSQIGAVVNNRGSKFLEILIDDYLLPKSTLIKKYPLYDINIKRQFEKDPDYWLELREYDGVEFVARMTTIRGQAYSDMIYCTDELIKKLPDSVTV